MTVDVAVNISTTEHRSGTKSFAVTLMNRLAFAAVMPTANFII